VRRYIIKLNYENYYKKYQQENIKRYTVNLSKEEYDLFKKACDLENITRSEYLKKEINKIIKRNNLQNKEK